jgi:hypothetical protein
MLEAMYVVQIDNYTFYYFVVVLSAPCDLKNLREYIEPEIVL